MDRGKYPVRVLNLFTIMNRGGAETMVMNYYRHIDRTKIQYDFMVHRSQRGAYDDEIEALGGKIYRFPPIRPWSVNAYKKQLRQFFKEHPEYQIIHAHMSELGYYAFVEAKRIGIPVRICHAHNRPYGFDLKTPARWYLKKRMMPYVTHMFMCGLESGKWLFGENNQDKFRQLNNAIDASKFQFDLEKRNEIRKELNIEDNLVIGHVGRFHYQKNHLFLIDIFLEILKKESKAKLLLVGDGNDREKIEKKVETLGLSEYVCFLGVRKDIPDLLQAMDVFLFPSLFEGLSVATIEAQAAGLPCLISDQIPIECKKTELVQQISLNDSAVVWAQKTLEVAKIERKDTYEQIKNAGFDIKENAKGLQQFYIDVVR